ncbi:hypothetical protein [Silvibacterium dinghuense]|uniref:Uncharacterized protein n=1 Tax=Silvibacterium dinghuense TaxID=1560006 RepID=A0A4Q1SIJ4_9BACT|nr:hypothetical protein [Silvibacterium dinghuense]RXS97225.1 hypothetical protein ESZ00_04745 [Silvibacterium dinghuense]GGG97244.1 hypothetical protein GCM10011586_10650 [Silvibacterium dinghuense]
MSPTPPYLVQALSGGGLLITEQPAYLFGACFAVPAMLSALFFLYRAVRARSFYPLLGILVFCAPFFCASVLVTKAGSLTLDRSSNTATFHVPKFFGYDTFTVPLDEIHFAEVRDRGQADYIRVVLKDGSGLSFSDANQDTGNGRAAHAINQYIGYDGE